MKSLHLLSFQYNETRTSYNKETNIYVSALAQSKRFYHQNWFLKYNQEQNIVSDIPFSNKINSNTCITFNEN